MALWGLLAELLSFGEEGYDKIIEIAALVDDEDSLEQNRSYFLSRAPRAREKVSRRIPSSVQPAASIKPMDSKLLSFIQVLRSRDVRISPAESLDAMDIASVLGFSNRQHLHDGLAGSADDAVVCAVDGGHCRAVRGGLMVMPTAG